MAKAKQIRRFTSRAKAVGKELNKYKGAMQMVPYAQPMIQGANFLVQAADSLAGLMESFSDGGSTHPQYGGGQVAGVSTNVVVRRTKPSFRSTQGVIRIVHKELISTVVSNVNVGLSPQFADGTSVFQINAGSGTTFPWLASIANNYEFYKFNRVRLVYIPLCATTEVGRIMLGYDPDSTDSLPVERQSLSSMNCSSEASAWGVITLDLKLSDTNKWYYSDASSVNKSSAYNDQGQAFWAAWANKDNSTSLGEVYVLYDVSLKEPQPNSFNVDQALGTGAATTTFPPANAPFFVIATATTLAVRFVSPGDYSVTLMCKSSATGGVSYGAGSSVLQNVGITDGTNTVVVSRCRVVTNFATITFNGLTALGNWEFDVTRIPAYAIYTNN